MPSSAAETRFLQWLTDNGAVFPKLEWPASFGDGGRGVRATAAIAPLEEMLRVPARLLISEALCWRDPQLGRVLEANRDVFSRDDPVLALFLVREMARGEQSFFHPYLAILPEPESVQDWTDAELRELRDWRLVDAARHRTAEIRTFYDRVFSRLAERYPGEFPAAEYSLERFTFAWKTIQARTFGRRLPWTALVPFADCLNHANVATTYDFDAGGNGCFRLFPGRGTAFTQGAEAFNSYGRRANFQLLLDYGFSLEDNEWDFVDVEIPREKPVGHRVRFVTRGSHVVRIDRQTTLDELFPPDLLMATGLPPPGWPTEPSPPLPSTGTTSEAVGEAPTISLSKALERIRVALVSTLEDLGGERAAQQDKQILQTQAEIPYRLRAAIIHRTSRRQLVLRMLTQLDAKLASCRGGDEVARSGAAAANAVEDEAILAEEAMGKLAIS